MRLELFCQLSGCARGLILLARLIVATQEEWEEEWEEEEWAEEEWAEEEWQEELSQKGRWAKDCLVQTILSFVH